MLLLGAAGKSAQLPLYVWLPDAMEGPTPVSALIHAATMVTAGVYMVARTGVLFELAPVSSGVVATVGALTALFAATIAMAQLDIKRVLAYSTISQLGYMFMGVGAAAHVAGVFHLMTHAFFKALLFLGAGSVIHAMTDEQDMRKMGGLARFMPWTFGTMAVAWLAISGIPPFAGFWSKDEILASVFGKGGFWIILVGGRPDHRPADGVLHDPDDVDDLRRQAALGRRRASPRVALDDGGPPGRAWRDSRWSAASSTPRGT